MGIWTRVLEMERNEHFSSSCTLGEENQEKVRVTRV